MEEHLDGEQSNPPVVFVSYSWVSEQHQTWVTQLARRLRANGVDVHLDRWDVRLGHDLDLFMERYADPSARVLVVLSDDYAAKADKRGQQHSGVGTETTVLSASVYRELGSNRVVPLVPDSGTVAGEPVIPIYLGNRNWIDFRGDYEAAYEQLLRDLHNVPLEAAPPLGKNPFAGTAEAQATAAIRNDPNRWRFGGSSGVIEVNLNENSGHFTLGSGDMEFALRLDYGSGDEIRPGAQKTVRHYNDAIGRIGLIADVAKNADRLSEIAKLPMSNRTEKTRPGDALVMLNKNGYWALLLLEDVTFRPGANDHEAIALVRYAIASDRSASLTLDSLPRGQ